MCVLFYFLVLLDHVLFTNLFNFIYCIHHPIVVVANRNQREFHLVSILSESERCVHDLSICLRQSTASGSSLSSALMKEKERQLIFWERRHRLLQRLKRGLDLLEPPPSPLSVHVEVVGSTSLLVHYFPPIRLQEKNIITKYKSNNNLTFKLKKKLYLKLICFLLLFLLWCLNFSLSLSFLSQFQLNGVIIHLKQSLDRSKFTILPQNMNT